MPYANPDALVSGEWLAAHLGDPDIRIVDATWFLPAMRRDARAEFRARHIPGAVFFDIDRIADPATDLPHMLPGEAEFARHVGALGIANRHRVIATDANGGFLAAMRAWWMFRVFGHANVAVLDGGLPMWLAEGRPTEGGEPAPAPAAFAARRDPARVRSAEEILAALGKGTVQLVDARSAKRFAGEEPEPRPTAKRGHIPGAVNLPYGELFDPARHFALRPAEEVRAALLRRLDPARPVVASCGSGVTACVVSFALHLLGFDAWAVYDGSWAEWGNRADTPVEP